MLPEGLIQAFGLYLVRTSALVLAAPLLASGSAFAGYRLGLVGVLSLVMFLISGEPLVEDPGVLGFALLAGRELVIGFSLAFVLHTVVLAVKVAGHMVGQEMGFNMASQSDPVTGTSTPIIGHFYETLFMLILLSVNGHLWMVRGLVESFNRAPVGEIALGSGVTGVALELFSSLFAAGLTFAAPVFLVLLLVSVLIGLLARSVPQINVIEFSFSARIIGGFLSLAMFAPMIEPASQTLLNALMDGMAAGLDALEVSGG
ncbi:MAG: flagellar biosynthetic protein FliR [Planctomycetota bacterium]|jgi:flagellar biosynthetic protein FliR